jgi:hypothetical protein
MGRLHSVPARVYYVHRMIQDGHPEEAAACQAAIAAAGVRAGEADDMTYALIGGSRESADLARQLLPDVTAPVSRFRIARALVDANVAGGRELLHAVLEEKDSPAEAFAFEAEILRIAGQKAQALQVVDRGLALHPTDPGLKAERELLVR